MTKGIHTVDSGNLSDRGVDFEGNPGIEFRSVSNQRVPDLFSLRSDSKPYMQRRFQQQIRDRDFSNVREVVEYKNIPDSAILEDDYWVVQKFIPNEASRESDGKPLRAVIKEVVATQQLFGEVPYVDLRSGGIVFKGQELPESIVSTTENTGPGIIHGDRFVPIKPDTLYKIGYSDDQLYLEPLTVEDPGYQDFMLHDGGGHKFPSSALLLVHNGGDGRVFAKVDLVHWSNELAPKPVSVEVVYDGKFTPEEQATLLKYSERVRTTPTEDPEAKFLAQKEHERRKWLSDCRAISEDIAAQLSRSGSHPPEVEVTTEANHSDKMQIVFRNLDQGHARTLLGVHEVSGKGRGDTVHNECLRFSGQPKDGRVYSTELVFGRMGEDGEVTGSTHMIPKMLGGLAYTIGTRGFEDRNKDTGILTMSSNGEVVLKCAVEISGDPDEQPGLDLAIKPVVPYNRGDVETYLKCALRSARSI